MKVARAKAYVQVHCQYCDTQISKTGIRRHETACYLNPQNKKQCEVCGNPVKNYKKAITCSHSCANTKFRTGPNHSNWKDSYYKTTCFFYHKKHCVICNEANIVEVHHLDHDNANNNPDNLVPLCPTHHQYWHSQFRYLVEDAILSYVQDWKTNHQLNTLAN